MDDAAIDHGRVLAARIQKRSDQRGGGRLTVGSGHRDVGAKTHQFGQHLGPAHNGQRLGTGGVQLRIARFDGGGDHDDLGLAQVLGPLADMDHRSQIAQPRQDRAVL